ncbi:MAG TPA: carboxypeptidase-like regulatory domain-containing protein, partial [Acidobacteriota bacterium]|nr:carboxypeptidase-like regulatory domain-containing protein [Acidobacteriota bacterium]
MSRTVFNAILGTIAVLLLSSVFMAHLSAQTGSLRLEGIVWDPLGNPIPGVSLTATEESTGFTYETVSDSDGYYRFLALPPGIYTVTAKTEKFRNVTHRNIHLFSPGSTVENLSFEVSTIDMEIGPRMEPRLLDSDIASSFSPQHVDSLPLLNRNPLHLSVFQAGVQINAGDELRSSIIGTRPSMNFLRRDGIALNNPVYPGIGATFLPVNPDSLANFQIVTTSGNAEYGGSGGGQIVLAGRRGTRSWSGTAYEYFRNHNLEANDFFANAGRMPRPEYTRHLFGGTLSGPVGAGTLFFANYEGFRTDQQIFRNRMVLTETARQGIFKWYSPDDIERTSNTVLSYDIAENDPRGIGIDPTVASLIEKTPEPNNSNLGDGLNTGGYGYKDFIYARQDYVNVRFDHRLNNDHKFFLKLDWSRSDATDTMNNAEAVFPGQPSGSNTVNSWGITGGSDYAINPMLVNELRFSFLKSGVDWKRPSRSSDPMLIFNSWESPLNASLFPR